MTKLLAFLELFRKGSAVSDPAIWKDRGGATIAVAGLIAALVQLAKAYGYELPLDHDAILAVAGGVATLVGLCVTYATSDKVGLPPKREAPDDAAPGGPDVPGNTPF
jgi:sugar phosphate permease